MRQWPGERTLTVTSLISAKDPWLLRKLRQCLGPDGLSLSRQFAATGGTIMLIAMIVAGSYISAIVTDAAIDHKAAASALLADSLVTPHVQSAGAGEGLSQNDIEALDLQLAQGAIAEQFAHIDIWTPDGTLIYSREADIIGRQFSPPSGLAATLEGDVAARYTDLAAQEHRVRDFEQPFLEIYVPVREQVSSTIIAVAEVHEVLGPLNDQLNALRLRTWLAVAAIAALIMAGLYWIVRRSELTIQAQQRLLTEQIARIGDVSKQNVALRREAEFAAGRVTELTERQLRGIGADLHDGPAQLMALAVLSLDHVRQAATATERNAEIDRIQGVLSDGLNDIRVISRGLLAPEFETLSLREVVDKAVTLHQQRTGTTVAVANGIGERPAPDAIKICLFRFIQEGLNNAFRHGGGVNPSVNCELDGDSLVAAVESGVMAHGSGSGEGGLGLAGLRHRVVSLGGTFSLDVLASGTTRLSMTLTLKED